MRFLCTMRYCLLIIFVQILFASEVQAQQNLEEIWWRETELVLVNGDTIRGSSILRFLDDIISIKSENEILQAFSAQNVVSFNVKGAEKNYSFVQKYGPVNAFNFTRQYKTFLWDRGKNYKNFKSPAFFEIIQPGKFTLLRRENRLGQSSSAPIPLHELDSYSGKVIIRDSYSDYVIAYYLINEENEIIPLRKPKKDIYKVFMNNETQIKAYVKKNNLSFTRLPDLARIIAYCNTI